MRKVFIYLLVITALVAAGAAFAQTPTNTPTATATATSTPTVTPTITPLNEAAGTAAPHQLFCRGKYNGACGSVQKGGATENSVDRFIFQASGAWNAYVDLSQSCDFGTTWRVIGTFQPAVSTNTYGQKIEVPVQSMCWIKGTKRGWVSGEVNVYVTKTGSTALYYYAPPTPTATPTP